MSSTRLDPSQYPRSYSGSKGAKWIAVLAVTLSVGVPCAMLSWPAVPPRWGVTAMFTIFFSIPYCIGVFRSRTTLFVDHIETVGLFTKQSLPRADVEGRAVMGRAEQPVLLARNRIGGFALPCIGTDQAWIDWMESAGPDLDREAVDEVLASSAEHPKLGSSTEVRAATWQRYQRLSDALRGCALFGTVASVIIGALYYPLLVLPWLALLNIEIHGVYTLHTRTTNPTIWSMFAAIIASLGVGLAELLHPGPFHVVAPAFDGMVWAALLCALPLWLATILTFRKVSFPTLAFLAVSLGVLELPYGYGIANAANVRFDGAPATPEAYTVRQKFATPRSKGGESFQLDLERAGGSARLTLDVPEALFRTVVFEGDICLLMHPGLFGVRWFTVVPAACAGVLP